MSARTCATRFIRSSLSYTLSVNADPNSKLKFCKTSSFPNLGSAKAINNKVESKTLDQVITVSGDEQKRLSKFSAANQINVDGKDRKPKCFTGDEKRAYVNAAGTTARFIFKTGKGKKAKYLGVVLK